MYIDVEWNIDSYMYWHSLGCESALPKLSHAQLRGHCPATQTTTQIPINALPNTTNEREVRLFRFGFLGFACDAYVSIFVLCPKSSYYVKAVAVPTMLEFCWELRDACMKIKKYRRWCSVTHICIERELDRQMDDEMYIDVEWNIDSYMYWHSLGCESALPKLHHA